MVSTTMSPEGSIYPDSISAPSELTVNNNFVSGNQYNSYTNVTINIQLLAEQTANTRRTLTEPIVPFDARRRVASDLITLGLQLLQSQRETADPINCAIYEELSADIRWQIDTAMKLNQRDSLALGIVSESREELIAKDLDEDGDLDTATVTGIRPTSMFSIDSMEQYTHLLDDSSPLALSIRKLMGSPLPLPCWMPYESSIYAGSLSTSGPSRLSYQSLQSFEPLSLLSSTQQITPSPRRAFWWKQFKVLTGHTDPVYSVAISPTGVHVASGSADMTVRIWDIQSGAQVCKLSGHTDWVRSVVFCFGGTSVVSGSDDTTLRVWDLISQKSAPPLYGHTKLIRSVAVSPDGTKAFSASVDKTVRRWDLQKRCKIGSPFPCHNREIHGAAISPSGSCIVTCSDDATARIWDLATGKAIGEPLTHQSWIISVAWSPDGRFIAVGSEEGKIRLYDAHTYQRVSTMSRSFSGYDDWVIALAFSPDSTLLLSSSEEDFNIRLADVSTGNTKGELRGHTKSVSSIAFSSDGGLMASASYDKSVIVWDAMYI